MSEISGLAKLWLKRENETYGTHHTRSIMLVRIQIFVWKATVTVNRSLPSSIVVDEVSSLYHEIFDYTMEYGILIASRVVIPNVFSGAKLSKVFTCLGTLRSMQAVRT